MAKISTYVKDVQLSDKDKVIGSNYINTVNGVDQFKTNNFTLKEISDFVGANISTSSVNLKANGGLVYETIDNVSKLAVDLGASSITGQLANADLANSSITINGTAISLGGTVTTPNTQLTDAQVRSKISVTGGGSYNSSTGVITIPAGFTLAQGNVTNASVSGQTLTLTRQSTSDVTFTPTANDFTNTLKTKLDNIESNATADQTAAEIRTLVEAATDSNVFTDNDHTKLDNIEANATGDQTASEIKTLYEGNSDTNAFTDADHTKLDGIAANAEVNVQANWNESTSTSDAFIQNKPTLFSGDYDDLTNKPTLLQLGTTSTTALAGNTSLLQLGTTSTTALAGNTTTISSTQAANITTNNAKTSFPGFGTTSGKALEGDTSLFSGDYDDLSNKPTIPSGNQIIDWTASGAGTIHASNYVDNDTIYTLPAASSSALGGIKIGYTESGKNYPVELDSEKAYVNVPWTDTNTQLSTEEVQDIIGGMVSSNTETNITVTYDDTNGKLDFASTDTNTQLTDEQVQDIVGAMVSGNTESNVTVTYDDTNGKLDFTASGTQLSKETVQDYVGEMLAGNTETRIAVTYDDANNKINFVADDQSYTLPTASSSTLGGVKVGGNLTIDNNGVLNVGAIALTTVQTAANETAHEALTAQEGDIVVRTDENKSYVHNGGTAGDINDYTELLTPTDAVLSVTTTDGTYIDLTPNSATTGAITVTADLSASDGTANNTARFLTKDNTWAVPAYTTDTNTQLTTEQVRAKFTAGTNITITNGEISATDTDTNTFRTVEVDSNGNDSANSTLEASETLRFKKGSNITLSEAAGVITISSTDTNTTYSAMGSGNSYAAGLVLAGAESHGGAFLRKDGTWQVPPDTDTNTTYSAMTTSTLGLGKIRYALGETPAAESQTTTANRTYGVTKNSSDQLVVNVPWTDTDTNTDTNTTYDLSVPVNTTKIRLAGSDSENDDVEIAGGTNVTVTRNSANKLTIAATDTNTDTIDMGDGFTVEADTNTATTTITENDTLTIAGGTNVTTVSNPDGTITINATDTNTDTVDMGDGFKIASDDGTDQFTVVENEEIRFAGGGATTVAFDATDQKITITSTDTNTDTNTQNTYGVSIPASTTKLRLTGAGHDGATTDDIEFVGSGATTVTRTSANKFTISSTDTNTNTQLSTEAVQDIVGNMFTNNTETNITATYQDDDGTIDLNVPNAGTVSGTGTTGVVPMWNAAGTGLVNSNFSFPDGYSFAYITVGASDSTTLQIAGGPQTGDVTIKNTTGDIVLKADNTTSTTAKFTTSEIRLNENTIISGDYFQVVDNTTTPFGDLYVGSKITPSDTLKGYRINAVDGGAYIDVRNTGDQIIYRDYSDSSGSINSRFKMDMSGGTFTASGDVIAFGSPSDISLKENIKPIENALDKVEKLQGITFNWKKSDSLLDIKEDIGFIAQDVQKVLPELVKENDNGKLSLRHQGIVPVLLEAIKELSDRIKVLENGSTK